MLIQPKETGDFGELLAPENSGGEAQPGKRASVIYTRKTPMLLHWSFSDLVCLIGIEPTHPAPEAGALSTELQAQIAVAM